MQGSQALGCLALGQTGSVNYGLSVAEIGQLTERYVSTSVMSNVVSETSSLSDIRLSVVNFRAYDKEILNATDGFRVNKSFICMLSDSLVEIESFTAVGVFHGLAFVDVLNISDTVQVRRAVPAYVNESNQVSDTITIIGSFAGNLVDSLFIQDQYVCVADMTVHQIEISDLLDMLSASVLTRLRKVRINGMAWDSHNNVYYTWLVYDAATGEQFEASDDFVNANTGPR